MSRLISLNSPDNPRYAYSMVNFWPLIEPFMEGRVCEIGAERGMMSRRLLTCDKVIELIICDPDPSSFVRGLTETPEVTLHDTSSLDAFACGLLDADVFLIDGDHNYYTVFKELEYIFGSDPGHDLGSDIVRPIAFAHDTVWPFGDRDLYYDYARIPPDRRHIHTNKLGAEPGQRFLSESGRYRVGGERAGMSIDSGETMGVGNAIKDYCKAIRPHVNYLTVPVLNGLTVLWGTEHPKSDQIKAVFGQFAKSLPLYDFMVEVERLRNDLLLHCIQVESELLRRLQRQ